MIRLLMLLNNHFIKLFMSFYQLVCIIKNIANTIELMSKWVNLFMILAINKYFLMNYKANNLTCMNTNLIKFEVLFVVLRIFMRSILKTNSSNCEARKIYQEFCKFWIFMNWALSFLLCLCMIQIVMVTVDSFLKMKYFTTRSTEVVKKTVELDIRFDK